MGVGNPGGKGVGLGGGVPGGVGVEVHEVGEGNILVGLLTSVGVSVGVANGVAVAEGVTLIVGEGVGVPLGTREAVGRSSVGVGWAVIVGRAVDVGPIPIRSLGETSGGWYCA